MTVHKAKGLEFPVVILADLTCRISRDDASRYLDVSRGLCAMKIGGWAPHELHEHQAEEVARDRAEGVRLAYVAATRARDLLVVPALGDGAWEGGWFGPLNDALYPPVARRRTAARGPKCPAFKSQDSVLERPNGEPAGPANVSPGEHVFEAGYSVVWWDPRALALGARPPFGVRRDDLIVKDVSKHVIADGRGRYDRWRLARADARSAGAQPSIVVQTVREWIASDESEAFSRLAVEPSAVTLVTSGLGSDESRPRGAAFGSLVHAVLARVPFSVTPQELTAIADVEARLLGSTGVDAAAAAMVVERVLAHALLMRARSAEARGACRREAPITFALSEGTLLEGVVDLAYEEDGCWTVVDYKTDSRARCRRRRAIPSPGRALRVGYRASHQRSVQRSPDDHLVSDFRPQASGFRLPGFSAT